MHDLKILNKRKKSQTSTTYNKKCQTSVGPRQNQDLTFFLYTFILCIPLLILYIKVYMQV